MVKNHNLAQKILDSSWSKFFQLLSYKAEKAGRMFVAVNPKGTSLENRKIKDRDYRASLNILKRGLGQPLEPVEIEPANSIVEAGSPLR